MAEFLGRKLILGTYLLGEYTEKTGKPFQDALQDFQKNPFKYIPLFIHTAINTTAEIERMEGKDTQDVTLMQVVEEVDRVGIGSKEVESILTAFVKSLETTVKVGQEKAAKKKKA